MLCKTEYLTYSLLFRQPEDETLSRVGAGKYLLAFSTCGLKMMHGYSHLLLSHVDESIYAANIVFSTLW